MPVIEGKVVRARYTSFKMGELSAVDRPAQPGALATIRKRDDTIPAPRATATPSVVAIAVGKALVEKYVDEDDGAHSFDEVLQANNFDEKIWPMTSALSQSIRSIMGDTAVAMADRETKVTASVDQFLSAVRDLSPETEKRLVELISKKDDIMPTVAELVAANPALKAHIDTIEGERDTAKAALTTEQSAHVDTKKALGEATDEVIKVDGNDVKKSEVGAASFAVFKSLDDRARTADVEKRVTTEFPNLVGTVAEKALVLKAVEAADEATKKAALAILTAAEKTTTAAFKSLGHGGGHGGQGSADEGGAAAVATFKGKVAEIKKRDSIPEHEATRKARTEFRDEFAAAYPDQAERA